jgi:outer membrane protein
MVRYFFVFISLLLASANFFAQTDNTWTITKCLEYAKENNISIKQLNLNIESSKVQTTQSWAALAPTANGSASHTWNYGLSFDNNSGILQNQQYQSSFYAASFNWVLFNGLNNYYTIMANQWNQKATMYNFEQAVNDVQLNIVQLFLQLLFAQERLEIVKQQVEAMRLQAERSKLLFDVGTITKGDYLTAQSTLSTQLVNLTNSENTVNSCKLSLLQALNLNQMDIQIVKPDFSNVKIDEFKEEASLEGIFDYALKNTPIIKSREANVWKFKRQLTAMRGNYYPSLSFGATISTTFSELRKDYTDPFNPIDIPYATQLQQNFGQQLSFRLSVPIFNGLSVRTNVKLAKIQWLNSKLDLENEEYKLKNTIQKSYIDARAAYKTYTANKMNLEALQETYNYAKDKFDVGVITSVEFNDAANKYFNAKTELLLAEYDYILKTKILDFYQGKKLEF